jgi:uncharacterized membrane protein YeiH
MSFSSGSILLLRQGARGSLVRGGSRHPNLTAFSRFRTPPINCHPHRSSTGGRRSSSSSSSGSSSGRSGSASVSGKANSTIKSSEASSASTTKDAAAEQADRAASLDFLRSRAKAVGLRLSRRELELVLSSTAPKDGRLAEAEWKAVVGRRGLAESERVTLETHLAAAHDLHLSQALLRRTAKVGVAFFALTGSHVAGAAGFHVVGASLVGCSTALGGGTINNLVAGSTPVGWARDPSFLAIAIAAALAGFYMWPLVEQYHLGEEHGGEKSSGGGGGSRAELARYAMESVALGALAVVGAQQGIVRGFHPLVSASFGVTIACGGVLRDLMVGRQLALGSTDGCQSYGVASLAGSSVYVALRELHVWNCAGSAVR